MVVTRSFAEYVKKRFDNNFWAAAESYLEGNFDSLGIELKRIHSTGEHQNGFIHYPQSRFLRQKP